MAEDVTIRVAMRDEASGGLGRLQQRIKAMRMEERASGEGALKSVLGRGAGGITDAAMDMAGIGLPAFIADQAGRQFASLAGKAMELHQQFSEGKISALEMTDTLAKGIPILGGWYDLGTKIREMWDGTADAVAMANRGLAQAITMRQHAREDSSLMQAVRKSVADSGTELSITERLAGKTGFDRERVQLAVSQERELAKLDEEREKAKEIRRGITEEHAMQLLAEKEQNIRKRYAVELGELEAKIQEDRRAKDAKSMEEAIVRANKADRQTSARADYEPAERIQREIAKMAPTETSTYLTGLTAAARESQNRVVSPETKAIADNTKKSVDLLTVLVNVLSGSPESLLGIKG